MKLYTLKSLTVNFIICLILVTFFSNIETKSQDLFGMLPIGPTSYVTAGTVSPTGDIYIAVWGTGVFRSNSQGSTWTPLLNGLTNFNFTGIAIISSSEILLTTQGGGVFKTTSLTNVVWKEANNGLNNLDVRTVKRLPNGNILLGSYGNGIYLSTDKGETWVESSKGLLYKDVTSIEVADNGWIVAGTYGGGIFQSRDGAKTWSRQSSGLKNLFINEIKINDFDYLYAATNGRGVYYSVNDGIAWAELDTFMTRPLKIDPVPLPDLNATTITFNDSFHPVFGSRYGGIYADDQFEDYTWVPTNTRGKGVNLLLRDKDSLYGFFPSMPPRKSAGSNEIWRERAKEQFEPMIQFTNVISMKEKELVAYSNNIVKKSTDEGKTWSFVAPTIARINKIAVDSSGFYYAATEKGLFAADPSLSSWNPIKSLDTNVLDVEISPSGTKFIATHFFLEREMQEPIDIRKVWYNRSGSNWVEAPLLFDLKVPRPHEIGVNYNGNIYVAAGNVMFYSTNDGETWASSGLMQTFVSSIGFFRDNTVIVGTTGAGLYKSVTVNSFVRINEFPANSISTVYIDKNNIMYISGENVLIDAAFAFVEATYISKDLGETFTNINNSFNGEKVMSFTVNNAEDMYMSTVSGMIYRAISKKNLRIPILVNQEDKAKDVDTGAEFKWTSSQRAELYQLQISYEQDFAYVWESVTQRDTMHLLHGSLLPNTKYYWRVRSKNHEAVSDWSEVRTFYSKLSPPELISPDDKEINIAVYAPLVWHKADGATNYSIQLSKSQNFNDIEFEWSSDDTTTTSPLLDGRTKYYWRVKALNDISSSDWSVIWSFETVFGPPRLLLPAHLSYGIEINPEMIWEKATEVTEYDIQIASDLEFKTVVFEKSNVMSTGIISTELNYDTQYYWRVRSRNGQVVSEWSLVYHFRTGYSPVLLTSPAHESVNVVINTIFNWQQHETQNNYELEVSKTEDFQNNVIFEDIINQTDFTAGNLESYENYFWRARVISDVNSGIWSNVYKFKTKVDKIGLRFPADLSDNHPVAVRFIWLATKGAQTYHLQIANDQSFNDLIFSQDTVSSLSHEFTQLVPASTYFWRVRAVSPEGVGDWSEVWQFTTGNNIPILVAPENGKTDVIVPVKFEWNTVTDAIKYEINISEQPDFTSMAHFNSDINAIFYISSELQYPKTYYWRIRANTPEGNSPWSQTWMFGTKDPNSVNEIKISGSMIYPNPSRNIVLINFERIFAELQKIEISDMTGKVIEISNVNYSNGLMELDFSNVNTGVYFIKVISGSNIYSGEVVIQK